MSFEVLREKKGGYSKRDVLTKLDALNNLMLCLEDGMPREKALAELEKIKQIEMHKEKGGFFGSYGFDTGDTDDYIADLLSRIEEKLR